MGGPSGQPRRGQGHAAHQRQEDDAQPRHGGPVQGVAIRDVGLRSSELAGEGLAGIEQAGAATSRRSGHWLSWRPTTRNTAIVSPRARPRPRSRAATMPGVAAGSDTPRTVSAPVSPSDRAAWRWAAGTAAQRVVAQRHHGGQDHDREEHARGEQRVAAERLEALEQTVDPVAQEEHAEQPVDHRRHAGQQLHQRLHSHPRPWPEVFGGEHGRPHGHRGREDQGQGGHREGPVDHRRGAELRHPEEPPVPVR